MAGIRRPEAPDGRSAAAHSNPAGKDARSLPGDPQGGDHAGHKRRLYPLGQFLDAFRKYLVPGRIPDDTAAEVASKIAEIDSFHRDHGFSGNKPGNPVRSLENKGVEPNSNSVRQTQSGPGLKTRKPLRRKGSDRVTGFETEKPSADENETRKSAEKAYQSG